MPTQYDFFATSALAPIPVITAPTEYRVGDRVAYSTSYKHKPKVGEVTLIRVNDLGKRTLVVQFAPEVKPNLREVSEGSCWLRLVKRGSRL